MKKRTKEDVAFITQIKSTVPDWASRLEQIRQDYRHEKKGGHLRPDWGRLVEHHRPKDIIEFEDWKRFIGFVRVDPIESKPAEKIPIPEIQSPYTSSLFPTYKVGTNWPR